MKVKAGTFKNVVVVKRDTTYVKGKEYTLNYYAPGVGLILVQEKSKGTKYKTKTKRELIKLKNK